MTVRATWQFEPARILAAADAAAGAMARTTAERARRNLRAQKAAVDDSSGRQFFTGGSRPGQMPAARTGHLSRSVTATPGVNATAYAGTDVAYGRHLEYGAIVRPKRARALTIPLNGEAVRLLRRHGSVRNIPGLRFVKTGGGKMFLVHSGGKRGKPKFLFVLKDQVRIAPRPWLLRSVRQAKTDALRAGQRAFTRALYTKGGRS